MPKIKYKATYRDPKRNPFELNPRRNVPVKTVEIDDSVPMDKVREMAEEDAKLNHYELVDIVKVV